MRLFIPMVVVVGLLAGCGAPQEAQDVSTVHFITFGPNVSGLVAKVKKPRMRACLFGISDSERGPWSKNVETAIMKWVTPMRKFTSAPLTTGVDVVNSRVECDAEIQIAPGTHSNTSIGQYPIVRMNDSGYFAGFNVLLHEFGHAFALSDTYQNGRSGDCQPGQPQAVMCNTSFTEPQSDDITGIQKIFQRVFPNDRPGSTPPENAALKLNVALGAENGVDRYRIHAAVEGTAANARGAVAYCLGTKDACTAAGAVWRDFVPAGRRGDIPLFAMPTELTLKDGMKVILRYQDEAGSILKTIGFEQEA